MKKILLTLILSTLIQISFGQAVKGIVVDGISNKPISNVNIQLEFSYAGTTTNSKGEFEINLNEGTSNLIFSHVNYDDHIQLVDANSKLITVSLNSKSNIIKEISISASSILDTISKHKQYSVSSYELIGDYLFWIENHGTFRKKLSYKSLDSDIEKSIWLDTIKNVEALQKSCNQRMYLTCKNECYPISIINDKIIVGEKVSLKLYQEFVEPCMLRNGTDLFYVRTKYNGLQTSYVRYDIMDESLEIFRTISEVELINGYLRDLHIIRQSQGINNITTNNVVKNTRIRNTQEKGDFLNEVVYKPKVSNYLYKQKQEIILLNHIDNNIEIYQNNKFVNSLKIKYHNSDNWLKQVVLDQETQEAYTLYKSPKGIELRRILIDSGESEFVENLDTDFPNYKSVKVHRGVVYYLGAAEVERKSWVLFSKVLK